MKPDPKSNSDATEGCAAMAGSGLEAWECFYPDTRETPVAASEWEGKTVTQRPDGGGFPLEKGVVKLDPHALDAGSFRLVTARHPDGIGCHTQECYPPEFTGCTLPCCCPNDPIQQPRERHGD